MGAERGGCHGQGDERETDDEKEGKVLSKKCDVSSANGGVYKERSAFSTIRRSEAMGYLSACSHCTHLTWHPDP